MVVDVRGTAAALRLAEHGDLPDPAFGRVSAQGVLTDQAVGVAVQEDVDVGAGRPGGQHAAVGAAQGEETTPSAARVRAATVRVVGAGGSWSFMLVRLPVSGLRRYMQQQRVTLTAAPAQGSRSAAASASAQFRREGQHQPGSGHADRVSERDRSAVDVHPVQRDVQLAYGSQGHSGERLVDLEQVQVGGLQPAVPVQGVADGAGRLDEQ